MKVSTLRLAFEGLGCAAGVVGIRREQGRKLCRSRHEEAKKLNQVTELGIIQNGRD